MNGFSFGRSEAERRNVLELFRTMTGRETARRPGYRRSGGEEDVRIGPSPGETRENRHGR
jgi:hypothetical protein